MEIIIRFFALDIILHNIHIYGIVCTSLIYHPGNDYLRKLKLLRIFDGGKLVLTPLGSLNGLRK